MVVLASKSPRRAELIKRITDIAEIRDSGFDESNVNEKSPKKLCRLLAQGKADCVISEPDDIVIGCDTIVTYKNKVYGKPRDREQAVKTIKELSGKKHTVITGVCIKKDGMRKIFTVKTKVSFRDIPTDEILSYTKTAEPYDKAGGYGIQGAGGSFVESISGSYTNVIGLPVERLRKELSKYIPVK